MEVPDRNGILYSKFNEFNVTGEDFIFNNSQKVLIINEVMNEIGWSNLTGLVKVIVRGSSIDNSKLMGSKCKRCRVYKY
jgi:hypothetical protein